MPLRANGMRVGVYFALLLALFVPHNLIYIYIYSVVHIFPTLAFIVIPLLINIIILLIIVIPLLIYYAIL